MINPKIFKAYDIRGRYPVDINEETAEQITIALITFLRQNLNKEDLKIVLSRDMRLSSPSLYEKTKQTLLKFGVKVIDVGLASTPTMYFAVLARETDAGVQISASHNPKDDNGFKMVKRDGRKIVKISKVFGLERIKEICLKGNPDINCGPIGSFSQVDILDEEIKFAFNQVQGNFFKRFKIVVDPANGLGAVMFSRLFSLLPVDLVKMNFDLDGNFPAHQPDPLQFKLLKSLQEKVVAEKADFGIAPDGDGDRVYFVDEKGSIVQATLISSLIANELFQKNNHTKVIVDIRYVNNVKSICAQHNQKLSICPVGHALITDQLNRENADFAGESSGHYYFKETGGAESSLRVVLHILNVLTRENLPMSQVLAKFSTSYESGEFNFELPENVPASVLTDKVKEEYSSAEVSTIDGVAVDLGSWRCSIRSSNTEPLLRLNVEAESESQMREKLEKLQKLILSFGARLKE